MDPDGLAQVFRALANPYRLRLFMTLASCCRPGTTCEANLRSCVGELGSELGIAASTVSHHLKELRQAGLIHMARTGQNVECWVEPDTLGALSAFFFEAGPDGGSPDQ
ncbi:MAG: metalloregulator ArsR/SmtB family transcription factor [Alphaproteobacteria bacterium]|nr:metalloregulator ArsR/SmtB family transcription factor [Alphaproteobacteria bacterium]